MLYVTNTLHKRFFKINNEITKKIFDDESRPKNEKFSFHEHSLNNPNYAINYNHSRSKILSKD